MPPRPVWRGRERLLLFPDIRQYPRCQPGVLGFVKEVFLTSPQTGGVSLGSRLIRLRLAAAHNAHVCEPRCIFSDVPAAVTAGGILGAVAVPVPAGLAVPAEQDDQNNLPDERDEVREEPRAAASGRRSRCTFEIRMQ